MKKNIFFIVFTLTFLGFSVNAQEENHEVHHKTVVKKEIFTVYGNCGMCKRTIEGSLKDVQGVILADWDKETDQMMVTHYTEKITLDAIKQKIADIGYDSDTHRAMDEAYNLLPGCCQYERPKN